MHHAPAVRRRKLGAELRRLRDESGVTSGEVARQVGWHQSKVSRIETGNSGVKPADLDRLLDAYGVADPGLRTLLTALSGADRGAPATAPGADEGPGQGPGQGPQGWWHTYREQLPPFYRDFIALEAEAAHARTLETCVIPGLLQTHAYASQVTRATLGEGADPQQVESLVAVRAARQGVLHAEVPLRLDVVLDEAALRREVGGPEVMREQLAQLVTAGQLPHVRLQVLPFSRGVHIGVTGPFVIFSFSRIADLDVVVLDHLTGSLHLEQQDELRAYSAAFSTLRAHALSYDDSLAFIAAIGDGR